MGLLWQNDAKLMSLVATHIVDYRELKYSVRLLYKCDGMRVQYDTGVSEPQGANPYNPQCHFTAYIIQYCWYR